MRLLILVAIALTVCLFLDFTETALAQATTMVILVRHAEKADGGSDPELSARGRRRAEALYETLAEARVDRIITTQYKRTRLTASVVADSFGIEPTVVGARGGLAAHVNAVADTIRSIAPGGAVLVVGHSNTVPAIIAALGGPPMADLDESAHSNLFVLLLGPDERPRLVRTRYGEPDS